MGLQTTPEVLLATAGVSANAVTADLAEEFARSLVCRSLVIHGDEDAITPLARGSELARLTGAELVVMRGSGHEPQCRSPQVTNSHIMSFLHHTIGGVA